jgi:hypothetical protein
MGGTLPRLAAAAPAVPFGGAQAASALLWPWVVVAYLALLAAVAVWCFRGRDF